MVGAGTVMAANATASFIDLWTPSLNSTFSWEFIAVLCVLISISFSVIAYMLASAFKSEETRKWAKGEMYIAFTSIFLIAFIIIFMSMVGTKATAFASSLAQIGSPDVYYAVQGKDIITLPLYYIEKVTDCVRVTYIRTFCFNFPLDVATSTSYTGVDKAEKAFLQIPSSLMMTGPAAMVNSAHILAVFLTSMLQLLYIQKHALYFLNGTMLTIFLPIGIILRTFAPTRGPGTLFISLAIGFGIVFPLAYGMVLAVQGPQIEQTAVHACGITTGTSSPGGGVFSCAAIATGSGAVSAMLLPTRLFPGLNKLPDLFKNGAAALAAAPSMIAYFNQSMSMGSDLMQYAVLYPLIVLGISMTAVRSLAIFLGGDAQEFFKGLARVL